MLPLSDGLHPRRFPFVNVLLIAANFAVWILFELPHVGSAVHHASFYPCAVDESCHAPEAWGISWFTAMSRTHSGTSATSASTSPAASSRR